MFVCVLCLFFEKCAQFACLSNSRYMFKFDKSLYRLDDISETLMSYCCCRMSIGYLPDP